jgi:hypothetical protein
MLYYLIIYLFLSFSPFRENHINEQPKYDTAPEVIQMADDELSDPYYRLNYT